MPGRENFMWGIALNAMGAELCHRADGDEDDLLALQSVFDRNITPDGKWLTPIDRVDFVMKGYSLLYVWQLTNEMRYRGAAGRLAEALLTEHPRAGDGSVPYDPGSGAILVDTLGMICPFLARFARLFDNRQALSLSIRQIRRFVSSNVDPDTRLPYHGYYADGPKRLGLHGWGRGTGWYVLGLADTLLEIPSDLPARGELEAALSAAAHTLKNLQRDDGHWTWAVLHREGRFDSSTTSMVGYSLLRGIQGGILDGSYRPTVRRAVQALMACTRPDGLVDGAMGECRGLGKYPQNYGPQPWAQGASAALAGLYGSMMGTGR